jgi:hypothetical protein
MAAACIGIVMSETFKVRRPTARDRDAWLELHQSLWPECPHDEQLAEVA